MARYRCFCMTEDRRIITGAFVDADYVSDALDIAQRRWERIRAFRFVEVWLGHTRVYPTDPYPIPSVPAAHLHRSITVLSVGASVPHFPASQAGWMIDFGSATAAAKASVAVAEQKPG